MMFRILICKLLVTLVHLCYSQSIEQQIIQKYQEYRVENTFEYAFLKTDKKIYYSGNIMSFSLVIFDHYILPSMLSKVAYLELIHEDGEFQDRYILELDSGVINGSIELPHDIPSGNYQLVAYTNYMRNFDLEKYAHRLQIYIQNTAEKPGPIAYSTAHLSRNLEKDEVGSMAKFEIVVEEDDSYYLIEINSESDSDDYLYLISENLYSLQFIARAKFKENKATIRIPKAQWQGTFHRLILVNRALEVLALKNYLFFNSHSTPELKKSQNGWLFGFEENSISSVKVKNEKSTLENDPHDLFKRIFAIYYDLPDNRIATSLNYEMLIAEESLSSFVKYSTIKWKEILSPEKQASNDIAYRPEQDLEIRGKLLGGSSEEKSNAVLATYFFRSGTEILSIQNGEDEFTVNLPFQRYDDHYLINILDGTGKNITDRFSIVIEEKEPLNYLDQVDFYNQISTDSLVLSELEFAYILSTYGDVDVPEKYFWESSNLIFDVIYKVDDYRGLNTLEEFIKEAIPSIFLVKRNGESAINMFNETTRKYEPPQLIILNNYLLKNSTPLFDLPLEAYDSFHIIFDSETMETTKSFTGGVIAIKTKKNVEIPERFIDSNLLSHFSSFETLEVKNKTAWQFDKTRLLEVKVNKKFQIEIKPAIHSMKLINIETFDTAGRYYHVSEIVEKN